VAACLEETGDELVGQAAAAWPVHVVRAGLARLQARLRAERPVYTDHGDGKLPWCDACRCTECGLHITEVGETLGEPPRLDQLSGRSQAATGRRNGIDPDRTQEMPLSRFRLICQGSGSVPLAILILASGPYRALSRRQRGFESRWEHSIELALTRSDAATTQLASPWLHRQGRARDA
jgi:hypothetical protein